MSKLEFQQRVKKKKNKWKSKKYKHNIKEKEY